VDDVLRRSVPARPAVLVVGDGPAGRAAAIAALGAGAAVVVLLATPGPQADAALRLAAPGVLGPATAEAAREHLATLSPSGRADVVVAADGDLAGAARHVRRGGAIVSVVAPTSRPSVTTTVQRELTLPTPHDLVQAALTCRLAGPGIRTTEGADHGH
jgi:threonine dehydrogenase-like Zn-dependent dehydrogenase